MKRTSIPSKRINNLILRPWEVNNLEIQKTHLEDLNDLQFS